MAGRRTGRSAAWRRTLPLALACGLGLLLLPPGVAFSDSSPVTIVVDENVAPGDGSTAVPPAGVGTDEPIGTTDAVAVLPPDIVPGAESVTVGDDVTVLPPVAIVVDESVSSSDEPNVVPPANLLAAETAIVSDDVSVVAASSPTTTVVTADPDPALFGAAVELRATVTSGGGVVGSGAVTFEDGPTPLGAPVPVDANGHASLTVSNLSLGSHLITADYGGSSVALASSATATLYVNMPPVASAGGPYLANEGSTLTLHGSATDTAGEVLTYSWDLGGGVTASGPSPSIVLGDGPGSRSVTVTVCDDHGACASDGATITIANVVPVARIDSPADGSVFRAGTHVALNGSFTDPGILDTHTATWTVGGTTLPATIAEHDGSGTATGTWTPAAAGFYPLSLTVTDKDGGATTVGGGTLVVFDAGAGSVTGLGALLDPGSNVVAFAFDARYRDHNLVPSGGVVLHVPHLDLVSTSLDWLVVTAPSFELQGVGRAGGRSGYRFLLTGVVGHSDKLRVQIWSPGGSLAYDSGLRPLRLGDIQIGR